MIAVFPESSAPVGSSARMSWRLVDDRPRDGGALLLTAGQFADLARAQIGNAQPFERIRGAFLCLPPFLTGKDAGREAFSKTEMESIRP